MIEPEQLSGEKNADPIGSIVERAILGILSFVYRFLRTFFLCLWRPTRIIEEANRTPERRTVTPPLTFLAGSILAFEGILRAANDSSDSTQGAFATLNSVQEMSLQKLILLAGPTVGVIALFAAVSARMLSPRKRFDKNPMAASICYALGFQMFLIGAGISLVVNLSEFSDWIVLVACLKNLYQSL